MASCPEEAQRINCGSKLVYAAILKILEMSTILNLTFIPEDEMSWSLLWR